MGIHIQQVRLDVSKNLAPPTIYLGQGDKNGETIKVEITDNGVAFPLTNYSVRFCMRLPHRGGSYEVDGTKSGNVATFNIDETYAAAVSGTTDVAFVQILSGDTVIASTSRAIVVVRSAHTDGVDPATAYDNGIQAFIDSSQAQLDEAIEEAAQTAAEHQAPAIAAKVPWPLQSGGSGADTGADGQLLMSNGDGTTRWGIAGTAQIADGAVTPDKLSGASVLTIAQIDALF